MTLQHVVLFRFPDALTASQEAELTAQVASFPREIGLMTRCRLGTDLTGERTRGYTHLLYTEFPDLDAMLAYRAHPVHLRFLDWLSDHQGTTLGFDYLLDERTVLMPECDLAEKGP